MRPKTVPTIETAAGIPIDLDILAKGSGAIIRDGQEINQEMRRPTTDMLVAGTRLFHTQDSHLYEIVVKTGDEFRIKRLSDGTEHAASLRQLKLCTYVFTEHTGSEGAG